MSNGAHRRQRRPHRQQNKRPAPSSVRVAKPIGTMNGAPVYDGVYVQDVYLYDGLVKADARVYLGIGPEDADPVAYIVLCPCDGVDGLVADLKDAGARAAEHHPPHG